jgi:hypothetical protein
VSKCRTRISTAHSTRSRTRSLNKGKDSDIKKRKTPKKGTTKRSKSNLQGLLLRLTISFRVQSKENMLAMDSKHYSAFLGPLFFLPIFPGIEGFSTAFC